MTREEAKEWLIAPTNCSNGDENDPIQKHWIAYKMAIKALEQEPKTGYWINEAGHIPKCSECGIYSDDADKGYDSFCPNCGAKMEVEDA